MAANLSQLFVGLFSAATGAYANQFKTSDANALASVASLVAGKDLSSDIAFTKQVLSNLTVPTSGAVYDQAYAAVLGLVNTLGRGGAVLAAADYLANVAAKDSTNPYYAVGVSFVAKVAKADAFTASHPAATSAAELIAGAASGSSVAFTTAATDLLVGTSADDAFAALTSATSSKITFNTGDQLIDTSSTDKDVLTLTAEDDVAGAPTITGIETINVNFNALTTAAATATQFDLALTNVAKGTAINVDNIAAVSAVKTLALTGDKGGVRTVSNDFTTVSSDVADVVTFNLNAVGSKSQPVALTLSGVATNVTVDAAGYVDLTAAKATGLVNLKSAKDATVTSAAAAAALFADVGGDLTVTTAAAATVLNLKAAGDLTASTLTAATDVTLVAGGDLTAALTAAKYASVSASGDAIITETANALLEISVSGNGGAVALDLTGAGNKTATVNVTGSQDVTVEFDASNVDNVTDNKVAINKASTGKLGVILSTAAGDADVSAAKYDSLEIAVDNNAKTVTVATGQAITLSADQTDLTIAGKTKTAQTNSIDITLDDGAKDANDVDLTSLTITDIAKVSIDASKDKTAANSQTTPTITTLIASTADVTIAAGSNKLDLGTTITLGAANTLTLTGSAATATMAAAITAAHIDASGYTAAVTMSKLDATKAPKVTTGSGNDVLTVDVEADAKKSFTLNTGAGDDTITLADAGYDDNTLVLDGGEGTDELILPASAQLTADATNKQSISISGIEKLTYTNHATNAKIDAALLNGQTWSLKDTEGTTALDLTIAVASSATSLDFSGLTVTTANKTNVKGDIYKVDVSGATSFSTFKGLDVAINNLTTGSTYVTATGGQYADTFTIGAGMGSFTGGKGADTFDVTSAVGATSTKFVTITDFAKNDSAGDAVDVLTGFSATTSAPVSTELPAGWTVIDGIAFKAGSSLSGFLTAMAALNDGSGANELLYAGYADGTDLYVYSTGASDADATDDILVKLTGVAAEGIEESATTANFLTIA